MYENCQLLRQSILANCPVFEEDGEESDLLDQPHEDELDLCIDLFANDRRQEEEEEEQNGGEDEVDLERQLNAMSLTPSIPDSGSSSSSDEPATDQQPTANKDSGAVTNDQEESNPDGTDLAQPE